MSEFLEGLTAWGETERSRSSQKSVKSDSKIAQGTKAKQNFI